eukprot:2401757-Ditylum_brightwellii.AAC.1
MNRVPENSFEAPIEEEAFSHDSYTEEEEEEDDEEDEDDGCYVENHPTFHNILGTSLRPCGDTTFCIQCNENDGNHPESLCCFMTPDFLYSPHGSHLSRMGINVGDTGCLSLSTWMRANEDGVAPPIWLESSLGGDNNRIYMERAGITAEFFFSHALDLEEALDRLHKFRAQQAIFKIMSMRQQDDTGEE